MKTLYNATIPPPHKPACLPDGMGEQPGETCGICAPCARRLLALANLPPPRASFSWAETAYILAGLAVGALIACLILKAL